MSDVVLEDCIVMDKGRIRRGARLRRVIVDRYNGIKRNARTGFDPEEERRHYTLSPAGSAVIPRVHRQFARGSYWPGQGQLHRQRNNTSATGSGELQRKRR